MRNPMSTPHDAGIFAEGLGKRYGDLWALRDVDLDVPQGTVLGLLGHNGAGKTTAVRILTTLLRPTEGRAAVAGHDVVVDAAIVRTRFGLAGQQATVDGLLTARANLEMVGRLYHLPRAVVRARADELLERLGLADAADRLVRTFSGGMRRRLDLAASLVGGAPGALPRRADHGPRPAQPHRAVEPARRARARRRDAAADHAVPRGGRSPGRRHRRTRRRPHRGAGLAVRAQGAHRRRAPRGDRRRRRRARARGRGARALRQRRPLGRRRGRPRGGPCRHRRRAGRGRARARRRRRRHHRPAPPRGDARRRLPCHHRFHADDRGGRRLMSAYAERLRFGLSDSLVVARRNLSHIRQIPEKLIDVTVQPLMFVILFAYVFGGAIAIPGGGSYHEYLMGGIFIQTLTFGVMGPATSMATDLGEGILDRFRSLPMARSAFLTGRVLAEFAAALLGLTVMTLAGLAVGWRINTDVLHALAGFGLLALVALVMLWLGILLGTIARSPDAVTGIVFIIIFPLTFVANAFVPAGTLPGVLRTFANWNPISSLVAATRTLFGNPTAVPADAAWPLQHPVVSALLWCVGLLAVAVPLAIASYRRRTEV